jgi:hypothetical protein
MSESAYWTTEQVAQFLGVSPQAVYDSRARNKFPGNRGVRRGKRLMFDSETIEQGARAVEEGIDPDSPETTNNVNTAILWELGGIHKTLRAIHNELRALAPYKVAYTVNTTVMGEEEE